MQVNFYYVFLKFLFKINEEFNILDNINRVVDLCAAPGSWSQILSEKINKNFHSLILSIDLQRIRNIKGVINLKGDITSETIVREIILHFNGKKADIVISDGAPEVTGLHDLDEYIQNQILISALNITSFVLRSFGSFLVKVFRGPNIELIILKLQFFFKSVLICKPRSSRNSSVEVFILCRNYSSPNGYIPTLKWNINNLQYKKEFGINKIIIPFIACGDLNGYDSDQNYPLQINRENSYSWYPPVSFSSTQFKNKINLIGNQKKIKKHYLFPFILLLFSYYIKKKYSVS